MECVTKRIVLPLSLPDPQEFEVHSLAGQGIERSEGLVHEDQLGIMNQCTGDRRALLHAAGQLVGMLGLKALEPDQVQERTGAIERRLFRQAEDLRRQQDIVEHVSPLQQKRLLKDHADVASRLERMVFVADFHLPGIIDVEVGQDLQDRRLAATRRPDE